MNATDVETRGSVDRAVILEVDHLVKHLPITSGILSSQKGLIQTFRRKSSAGSSL